MRNGDARLTARRRQRGFSYIGLMLMIVIAGIGLAAAGISWQYRMRSEREQELLFVGQQYRAAIASYLGASANGLNTYPATLDDLLLDRRFPNIKRHLRKRYADPITGSQEWGLVKLQGRIIGVYSLSRQRPRKQAGFKSEDQGFKGASSYRDWVFGQQLLEPAPSFPAPAAQTGRSQPQSAASAASWR